MIFFNSLGIVQFIGYIIDTRGGMSQFVEHCLIENIRINFGSPPFFCLLLLPYLAKLVYAKELFE